MSLIMEEFVLPRISQSPTLERFSQDAPIIKLVNKILLDAINKQASDIHFELYDSCYRIRYRRDGLLTKTHAPPLAIAKQISTRIKVMANLDISECRKPQDGSF